MFSSLVAVCCGGDIAVRNFGTREGHNGFDAEGNPKAGVAQSYLRNAEGLWERDEQLPVIGGRPDPGTRPLSLGDIRTWGLTPSFGYLAQDMAQTLAPILRNCVLNGNDGGTAGGAVCAILGSGPQLINCTIIHNTAADTGGGLYLYKDGAPRLTNCVLWHNDAALGPQLSLYCTDPVDLAVSYSVVEGGQAAMHTVAGCVVTWGPGNLEQSPLVLADGQPRVNGPRVDLGADECHGCPLLGDLNCDGALDFFDIDSFVLALTDPALYQAQFNFCDIHLADANLDGVIDFFDLDPFVGLLVGG